MNNNCFQIVKKAKQDFFQINLNVVSTNMHEKVPKTNNDMNNQMNDLFKNMNIPNLMKNMGMGGGGKFNQGAFNNMMNENMKNSKMRDRMRTKLESRKQSQPSPSTNNSSVQDNIKNNYDYLFNNPNSIPNNTTPDLTELNNSLQTLVEQMKLNDQSQTSPYKPSASAVNKKKKRPKKPPNNSNNSMDIKSTVE